MCGEEPMATINRELTELVERGREAGGHRVHSADHVYLRAAQEGVFVSDRSLPGVQPVGGKKRSHLPRVVMAVALLALVVVVGIAFSAGDSKDDDYISNTSYEAIARCREAIKMFSVVVMT